MAEIERRYGQEIRDNSHIEPAALTRDEATYILGFRNADALRNRFAASAQARVDRLRSKGIPAEDSGLNRGAQDGKQALTEARSNAESIDAGTARAGQSSRGEVAGNTGAARG